MRNNIFDQEMRGIHRDSITMCNLAAEALQDAMDAVRRRDFTMVDRVLELDKRIRNMRPGQDALVFKLYVTRSETQPVIQADDGVEAKKIQNVYVYCQYLSRIS